MRVAAFFRANRRLFLCKKTNRKNPQQLVARPDPPRKKTPAGTATEPVAPPVKKHTSPPGPSARPMGRGGLNLWECILGDRAPLTREFPTN